MIGSTGLWGSGGSLCRIQEKDCPRGRIMAGAEQEGAADPVSMAGGVCVCVCLCVRGRVVGFAVVAFLLLLGRLTPSSPLLGSLVLTHYYTKCWPLYAVPHLTFAVTLSGWPSTSPLHR